MRSLTKTERQPVSWPVLKALYDLYSQGRSSAKIQQNDLICYLLAETELLSRKKGNNQVLLAGELYPAYFEAHYLPAYQYYKNFLVAAGIKPDARKKMTEEDLQTLMIIYESREEIRGRLSNIEDFSAKVFDYGGSKYLKEKDGLRQAVLTILGIDEFPATAKDLQYRLVVDHPQPKSIILCENKSFLKQPWHAKTMQVKLWHVGGNNIGIIDDIDEQEFRYPIYYSCDWDLAGLEIYQRIRKKLANLHLLTPPLPHLYLPTNSFQHKSRWRYDRPFSGLDRSVYTIEQQQLIQQLIDRDEWIEEESNDLSELYLAKDPYIR